MYFEGRPLVYYYDYQMPSSYANFPYFRRFEERARMSDEFLLPNSPHSAQSDSDASVSSIDVHPEPIKGKFNVKSNANSTARCCWQNCGIAFESLEKLSDHVAKVHAVSGLGGLYYCLWEGCTRNNKGFNARYKMLVHVRTHTNEKPHRCTLCHKSFSRAENLKIHTRSHSGERPYLCPVPGCNKAYSNSSDRFKHTRTHQVDKPYQCKVAGCTKRYTDPSSLRKHVKTYKHFVETIKNEERDTKGRLESDKVNCVEESSRLRSDSESSIGCSCDHLPQCYYSNRCLEREFIGRMNEERTTKWRSFMEPYLRDERDEMEIELPLDLSIRRHY